MGGARLRWRRAPLPTGSASNTLGKQARNKWPPLFAWLVARTDWRPSAQHTRQWPEAQQERRSARALGALLEVGLYSAQQVVARQEVRKSPASD